MNLGHDAGRTGMHSEPTETMLEQRVRPLEVAAQPPHGSGTVPAGQRLLAGEAEELPVHSDQEPGGDARIARIDSLQQQRIAKGMRERRHDLELLRPQRGRLLENPREGGEAGAAQPAAFLQLQPSQRRDDRLAVWTRADRLRQRLCPLRDLVVEEVLLGREVIENRLLGDVRRRSDLSYGDSLEAALGEEPHRRVGDQLPRCELLRLAQAHNEKCNDLITVAASFQPLYRWRSGTA